MLKQNSIYSEKTLEEARKYLSHYDNDLMTLEQIAQMYEKPQSHVHKLLRLVDYTPRSRGKTAEIKRLHSGQAQIEQEIARKYAEEGLSTVALANLYNFSQPHILNILERQEVKIRSKSEAQYLRGKKKRPSQESIERARQMRSEGASYQAIKSETGISYYLFRIYCQDETGGQSQSD